MLSPAPAQAAPATIAWQDWSATTFDQAQRERKFVFLYLEAVWCHWCHVMQAETLPDAAVQARLQRNYLSVRVDHDADPLLARRYRNWGWPALIFLAPDGTEIVKRAGYQSPQDFARLLDAIVADPAPEAETGPAASTAAASANERLPPSLRAELQALHREHHDTQRGGLRTAQRYLDRNSVEWGLTLAAVGDDQQRRRTQQTLDAARALIDPVWGGVYQYSTGGRWDQPHYEKIMRSQAGVLRAYALAYGVWRRPQDRRAANAIVDYLLGMLRDPSGAFSVSQDADLVRGRKAHDYFALDDAGRRRLGIPRIDRTLYADANGQAVEALATLNEFSGDLRALAAARAAAAWVLQHRGLDGGGFRHGERDAGGPYLSDTLAMARACLALYRATAERIWLQRAIAAADFIGLHFRSEAGGFLTAARARTPVSPLPDLEENISTSRFLKLLHHFSGRPQHLEWARHGQRYLTQPQIARTPFEEAGILLADAEFGADPAHVVVVGSKQDAQAQALYATALRIPGWYKRVEWWDRSEGPLPNDDVPYPVFPRAAAYVCAQRRCSAPSFDAAVFRERATALLAASAPGERR